MKTERDKSSTIGFFIANKETSSFRLCCLLLVGLVWIVSLIDNTQHLGYVSLVFSLVYFLSFVIAKPTLLLKYLPVFFTFICVLLGVFSIETQGFYLDELGIYSSFVGSFPTISFFLVIALFSLEYFDSEAVIQNSECHYTKGTGRTCCTLVTVILPALVVVAILAIQNPFFSFGVDRMVYAQTSLTSFVVGKVSAYGVYLLPIYVVAFREGLHKRAIACVGLYVLIAFLAGNKFGVFLEVGWLILLCFMYKIARFNRKQLVKIVFATCAAMVVFISIPLLHNSLNYGKSINQNIEYLESRLAQSGQLWWRSYDLQQDEPIHIDELGDEFASWFNPNADPVSGSYGIYKVMKQDIVFENTFYSVVAHGSRYTSSSICSIYYYFGYGGLFLFAIITGYVFARVISSLTKKVIAGNVIKSVFMIKFYMLAAQVLTMSDFDQLMSFETLGFLAAYFIVCRVSLSPKVTANKLKETRQRATLDA